MEYLSYKNYYSRGDASVVQARINTMYEFLEIIHPTLETEDDKFVEIRKIKRAGKGYNESFLINQFNDENKQRLQDFLYSVDQEEFQGCMYYSTFSTSGENKGFTTNKSAIDTSILIMDFDKISHNDFINIQKDIENIGFEIIVINTGKGFQGLILLDEPTGDKDVRKNFTELLLRKGFPVDAKIKDAARVFRMPNTLNFKYIEEDKVAYETKIINMTTKRYNLDFVFEVFEAAFEDVDIPVTYAEINKFNAQEDTAGYSSEISEKDYNLKEMYGYDRVENLPLPIRKMLMGQDEGYRNETLVYLTYFLNRRTSLKENIVVDLLCKWGDRCNPKISKEEIISEYQRLSKYKYIHYDAEMQKRYGYIPSFIKEKIVIQAQVFDVPANFKTGSINLYLALLLEKAKSGKKSYTTEQLQEITNLKKDAFIAAKKVLLKSELLKKKKRQKRTDSDTYYLTPYFYGGEQFLYIPITLAERLVTLKSNQIITYLLILKHAKTMKNSKMSIQNWLAIKLNITHQAVSVILKSLVEANLLQKETYLLGGNFKKAYYTTA